MTELFAQVDDWRYDLVSQYTWSADRSHNGVVYARRFWRDAAGRHSQAMHTLITGWLLVDHRDRNGLNCQEYNMREATHQQNLMNSAKRSGTSRFKGVALYRGSYWQAGIRVDGRRRHIGYFDSEVAAARAYDAKAVELFGDFARTNEMLGLYGGA